MESNSIRKSFIDYFLSRGHTEVKSSPLVPADDPTLLFTNAGMVQFKRVFQGLEKRDYDRAVSSQKCVRAGGKHNDLEQVGHTARHHTFFEMFGNFSFGDYFKKEAIEYAWEWVTSEDYLGIHPDRVYVTVHETDEDARRLWREVTGIANSRIYGLGDKDNFWQMGDTGPCGPCSEIYVDVRTGNGNRETGKVNQNRSPLPTPSREQFEQLSENGQLSEIWNLVFMQFDQASDGTRSPLPAPSVDTGAGLERIAAVMQNVASNFDTDLFAPVISKAEEVIGRSYDHGIDGVSFRVLADHARAIAFLLADGVYPSNDGRGYVLRRILRRAVRHAYLLGRRDPTLAHLAAVVVDQMKDVYPELAQKAEHIANVTEAEEERFLETIDGGLERLEELTSSGSGIIDGEQAFKLYDTYGFPIDLTEIVAGEKGLSVDVAGFEKALARQQRRSREAREPSGKKAAVSRGRRGGKFQRVIPRVRQKFVGYETTEADTDILAFRQSVGGLELILHENPFYLESGGQVSDSGVVVGQGWELEVDLVNNVDGKTVVSGAYDGPFEPTPVRAVVAEERRRDIERNHTATHLVHAALREVLGTHVRQAGSVVDPVKLRFDFSHQAPVTEADLADVEEVINEGIWKNLEIATHELPYAEAIARGAIALFGEKYGDRVRVVDIPSLSLELCGGTHVRSTGQIGLFRFSGETGVAAGVRRIEAITGRGAYGRVRDLQSQMDEATEILRTSPDHVAKRVDGLLEEKRKLEKRVQGLVRSGGGSLLVDGEQHELGDVSLTLASAAEDDRTQIGLTIDAFRARTPKSIVVVFSGGDRPGLHVGVTDDLVSRGIRAGEIAARIAALTGGRGGGRPHFASAGVGDPTKVAYARSRTPGIVAEALGLRVDV